MTPRSAVSAIELLVVIGIMITLVSLSMPGIYAAQRRSAVQTGAEAILRVAAKAQQLAKHAGVPEDRLENCPHYGIAISTVNGPAEATLIFGSSANDVAVDATGAPSMRVVLPRQAQIWVGLNGADANALSGTLIWYYQFGSGRPLRIPTSQEPVSIGVRSQVAKAAQVRNTSYGWLTIAPAVAAIPDSTVCTELSVRSLDGRYRLAVAVYPLGLSTSGVF